MFVGDADTLVLNVGCKQALPRAGEGDHGDIFSIHGATAPSFFKVFDLLLTCMTELQCSGIDLSSFLSLKTRFPLFLPL